MEWRDVRIAPDSLSSMAPRIGWSHIWDHLSQDLNRGYLWGYRVGVSEFYILKLVIYSLFKIPPPLPFLQFSGAARRRFNRPRTPQESLVRYAASRSAGGFESLLRHHFPFFWRRTTTHPSAHINQQPSSVRGKIGWGHPPPNRRSSRPKVKMQNQQCLRRPFFASGGQGPSPLHPRCFAWCLHDRQAPEVPGTGREVPGEVPGTVY